MSYNRKLWFALRNKLKDITEDSGIYLWTRVENGITYFYVGQAKNLRNRRTDYEMVRIGKQYPTRHFEASLRKHRDWKFEIVEVCPEFMLDKQEQHWINFYNAQPNHITRNDLLSGQDQVRTNYHRIEQIEKRQNKAISKCLGYLTYTLTPNSLKIGLKTTKKGIPTAISTRYFNKLLEILGLNNENNK